MLYLLLSVWFSVLALSVYVAGNSFGFGVFVVSIIAFFIWQATGTKEPSSRLPQSSPSPVQSRSAPQGFSHTASPVYKKLLVACGGDKAVAERLIRYEMRQDPRLTTSAATVVALDRLYVDRRHGY